MAEFLIVVACLILVMVAVGLARVLAGSSDADRMMAAQLLGTGGVAILLLVAVATDVWAGVDVAVILALLAAFAAVAFANIKPADR